MKVVNLFSYTDWEGHTLTAQPGYVSDGATIPRAAWSIVGGPWDGTYIKAAIVHDVGCDTRSLSWQVTDRLFYEAMIDSNVPKAQALTMYYAVLIGGPRWVLKQIKTANNQAEVDSYIKDLGEVEPPKEQTVEGLRDLKPVNTPSDNQKERIAVSQDKGDDPNAPIIRLKVYSVRATQDVSSARLKSLRDTISTSEGTQTPITAEDIEKIARNDNP